MVCGLWATSHLAQIYDSYPICCRPGAEIHDFYPDFKMTSEETLGSLLDPKIFLQWNSWTFGVRPPGTYTTMYFPFKDPP